MQRKKKSIGRPPSNTPKREWAIRVLLNEDEYIKLHTWAEESKTSMSDYIRIRIFVESDPQR